MKIFKLAHTRISSANADKSIASENHSSELRLDRSCAL